MSNTTEEGGARMPRMDSRPRTSPRVLDALILELQSFDPVVAATEYPWADRFVMGLPLAPWQREFKWSMAQCERFITSVWTGVHLGTWITNKYELVDKPGGGVEYQPLSNIVIDGQQRLKALELYLLNELPVPDVDGKPTFWKDVHLFDKRRFKSTVFAHGELELDSEHELRAFYDTLNFGGVAHEEHERALKPGARP